MRPTKDSATEDLAHDPGSGHGLDGCRPPNQHRGEGVAAFHAFRFRNVHDRRDALLLGYGLGAVAIVWWEILEWLASDDGIGSAGGLIGSWVGIRRFSAIPPLERG